MDIRDEDFDKPWFEEMILGYRVRPADDGDRLLYWSDTEPEGPQIGDLWLDKSS